MFGDTRKLCGIQILCPQRKLYWDTAILSELCIFYGWFCGITAELSSCDRDCLARLPKNSNIWNIYCLELMEKDDWHHFLVHFILLWENTCNGVIYRGQEFIWVKVLEAEKSKGLAQACKLKSLLFLKATNTLRGLHTHCLI